VIARRLGALTEIVEESGGGLLFDTAEELADSIRRLVDDAALRTELGRRGLRAVETTWSEETQVDAYIGLVESLSGTERVSVQPLASATVRAAGA
jgi:glycosyltransferase involved in cell wall biosynthesis